MVIRPLGVLCGVRGSCVPLVLCCVPQAVPYFKVVADQSILEVGQTSMQQGISG